MTEENVKRLKEGLVVFIAFVWAMLAIACSMLILNHLGGSYVGPALFNAGFHAFGIWYFVKHSKNNI